MKEIAEHAIGIMGAAIAGYFLVGEVLLGTLCGLGRLHSVPVGEEAAMKWLALSGLVAGVGLLIWRKRDQPWPCLMGKHDAVLTFGKGEIFLRCTNCQRRTNGWEIGKRREMA